MNDYDGDEDDYGDGADSGYGYCLADGSGYGGYGGGYGDGPDYSCHGSGYGHGYGHGICGGSGDGSGYGDGYGLCYAGGEGYGSHDYGDGFGYGYGDGVPVATLGEYEVRAVVTPWGRAARVGCQVHDLSVWRERWRAIAHEHDVEVSAEEAARLIARIEEMPLGVEWLESEEGRRGEWLESEEGRRGEWLESEEGRRGASGRPGRWPQGGCR